jgi:hypothetical protein
MMPLTSRRRARRRSLSRRLSVALIVLLVLVLLIGGATQIGKQSHTYDVGANRALGAQGSIIAAESNVTAAHFRALMGDMQTLSRQVLESDLDALVLQASEQSALAQRAAGGADGATVPDQFARVFVDRADAMTSLRATVDGLLGMHPAPVAGAPVTASAGTPSTPTLLTSTQAITRLSGAGAELVRADGAYRGVRAALRRASGHASLPASVWVTNPQLWGIGAVTDQVDLLTASPSLEVSHYLKLQTVRLTPPALPPAPSTALGTSVLSPTPTVSITVVLANLGSVDEPHAVVQFALAPQAGGSAVTTSRTAAVAAGGSVTLDTVTFSVRAGHTYQLTVAVVVPPGQATAAGTTTTETLEIAQGT